MASKKFLRLLRSPYFWITVGALLWIGLLDPYSWVEQVRLARRLAEMRQQYAFYEQQTALLRKEAIALAQDAYTQEAYAREHYRVKRPGEKLFILQRSSPNP
ncbi:MAG: hypothetical protein KatS3mg026_1004 [Bacteroidia bacterium]|nr:MAG: hypothetical protein KatS3mg026_1004 [Bacteroidia bacterium]